MDEEEAERGANDEHLDHSMLAPSHLGLRWPCPRGVGSEFQSWFGFILSNDSFRRVPHFDLFFALASFSIIHDAHRPLWILDVIEGSNIDDDAVLSFRW